MKIGLIQLVALSSLLAVTNVAHAIPFGYDWITTDLNFGDVAVGDTSTLVAEMLIDCPTAVCDYSVFSPTAIEFSAPGGTVGIGTTVLSIDVTFAPISVGLFLDPLIATIDDRSGNAGQHPLPELNLEANAVAAAVPEPSTLALLGAGLIGCAWRRRNIG